MRQVKYFCDLCKEECKVNELYGYRHVGLYGDKNYQLVKDLDGCGERYICVDCFETIRTTNL